MRRALLGLARFVKPVMLPLLHRLEWRIRTAVEKTAFASEAAALREDVRRLAQVVEAHEAARQQAVSVDVLVERLAEQQATLERLAADSGMQEMQRLARQEDLARDLSALTQAVGQALESIGALRGQADSLARTGERAMEGVAHVSDALARLSADERNAAAVWLSMSGKLDNLIGVAGQDIAQVTQLSGKVDAILGNLGRDSADLMHLSGKIDRAIEGAAMGARAVADTVAYGQTLQQVGANVDRNAVIATAVSEKLDALAVGWAHRLDDLAAQGERAATALVPLDRETFLVRNRYGFLASSPRDLGTLAYLGSGYLPEAGTLALVEELLKPGDKFIDVGANVGLFTIAAGWRVGPAGKVLAFEPTPETARLLGLSVEMNGLSGLVQIEQAAVGSRPGRRHLHLAPVSGHNSLFPLPHAVGSTEVDVLSLDDFIERRSQWSLVKIDAEGAELEILSGMKRLLNENPGMPIILEFAPSHIVRAGATVETWRETVASLRLTAFEIDDRTPTLRPLRTADLDGVNTLNLLLVRSVTDSIRDLIVSDHAAS